VELFGREFEQQHSKFAVSYLDVLLRGNGTNAECQSTRSLGFTARDCGWCMPGRRVGVAVRVHIRAGAVEDDSRQGYVYLQTLHVHVVRALSSIIRADMCQVIHLSDPDLESDRLKFVSLLLFLPNSTDFPPANQCTAHDIVRIESVKVCCCAVLVVMYILHQMKCCQIQIHEDKPQLLFQKGSSQFSVFPGEINAPVRAYHVQCFKYTVFDTQASFAVFSMSPFGVIATSNSLSATLMWRVFKSFAPEFGWLVRLLRSCHNHRSPTLLLQRCLAQAPNAQRR
jgi:hypothetical protein